jgi:hypothetical protein
MTPILSAPHAAARQALFMSEAAADRLAVVATGRSRARRRRSPAPPFEV